MTERNFVIDRGSNSIEFEYGRSFQQGDKKWDDYHTVKASDLRNWLDGELSAIPESLRDNAVVSLFACDISFYYLRPETDEEMDRRLKEEKMMEEKQQDEKDRKEYERLKAKFE